MVFAFLVQFVLGTSTIYAAGWGLFKRFKNLEKEGHVQKVSYNVSNALNSCMCNQHAFWIDQLIWPYKKSKMVKKWVSYTELNSVLNFFDVLYQLTTLYQLTPVYGTERFVANHCILRKLFMKTELVHLSLLYYKCEVLLLTLPT